MPPILYKLIVIALLACQTVWPQTHNDPVYVNGGHFTPSFVEDTPIKSPIWYFDSGLVIPGRNISNKTKLYYQFNYKLYQYNFSPDYIDKQSFTDARTGLIINHTISDKYEMLFLPRLHLRTNFEKQWQKRSFFPSISTLLLRNSLSTPELTYGIGVSLNNDLNRNSILPLVYLNLKKEKYRINAIVPVYVYLTVISRNRRAEYGLATNFDAQIFHAPIDTFTYLKTRNILFGATFSYNISDKIWLNSKTGVTLFRNFELLDKDFNAVSAYRGKKMEPSFFITTGLSWRFEQK